MGRPRSSEFYLDPEELRASVIEMQSEGHMTERFARHLLLIQEKVLQFPRYRGYNEDVKEEMRSHNQMRWVSKGWKTIDPNKNCFAYITQGCYLNFLQALTNYFRVWNKQKEYMKMLYEWNGLDWRDSGYDAVPDPATYGQEDDV